MTGSSLRLVPVISNALCYLRNEHFISSLLENARHTGLCEAFYVCTVVCSGIQKEHYFSVVARVLSLKTCNRTEGGPCNISRSNISRHPVRDAWKI